MIRPNKRFPDMKALTDYIHAKGLKAGIYTSPGPLTCAGFYGSYQHEAQDARPFAEWGFDFLKYDWCSYDEVAATGSAPDAERLQTAVPADGRHPQKQPPRHRLQSLPVRHGRRVEVGRRGGRPLLAHDRRPRAGEGQRLPGFYSIGFKNAEHAEYAGPGRWNDPDYILIGCVGNAYSIDEPPKPTTLTPTSSTATCRCGP